MKKIHALVLALVFVPSGLCAQAPATSRAGQDPSVAKPAANDKSGASQRSTDSGAEMTTATFGDWIMRCQQIQSIAGQPQKKTCEVVQTIVLQEQNRPFAQLAFGKLSPNDPLYFTAVVPTNVTFPSSVKVAVGTDDKAPTEITWTRCLNAGCFASLALTDDVLKRWRSQDESGRLSFKDGAGQDLTVPFSFRGLARALDALGQSSTASR